MASKLHQELYLHQLASLVRIQGCEDGLPSGPALAVDLKTGSIGTVDGRRLLVQDSGVKRIFGIIGLQKLTAGFALAVVTSVKQVAMLRGHPIFQVTGTQVFPGEVMHDDDERYAGLLRYAVAPSGAGIGLYFSYEADLGLTQQGFEEVAADHRLRSAALADRADPRFYFNRQLIKHLAEASVPGVQQFILPLMMGSVQQLASVSLGGNTVATITLIARRSVQRPGVRHWRRGADAEGAVANFVETEQLVELSGAGGGLVSSFVQIRGSIPLLWSQVPNIKYKPTTRLGPKSAYQQVFDSHIASIVHSYKEVVAVNLANQHGSEGVLSSAFREEADRYAGKANGLKLVAFDFHKQCGATRYDRLALLWNEVRDDFKRFGFYVEGRGVSQRQGGVFRVNCIDCLDRTNVVQCVLARHHLEELLNMANLLGDSGSLPRDFPKVEVLFKGIWANHGDDISKQYAGTGALKSGFTRTGVRTKAGLADDGYKSAMRYLLNNFQDGHKQDALDFATGAYLISRDKPSPFRPEPKPLLPFMVMLLAGLIGAKNLLSLFMGRLEGPYLTTVVRSIITPFAFSAIVLFLITKLGKKLVNRPQLRPDLSQPW